MIYIAGTFLAGPNKGVLLTAVGQDSCDQLIIIAAAAVESENSSSWNWFLDEINKKIRINSPEVVIVSDGDKGILNALNTVTPSASRSSCIRHYAKNLKLNFKDKKNLDLFYKAANTYSKEEFEKIMNTIKEKNLAFYERLIVTAFKHGPTLVSLYQDMEKIQIIPQSLSILRSKNSFL